MKFIIKFAFFSIIAFLQWLPLSARQVYVGFNALDCAHCMAGTIVLKELPGFASFKFVLKSRDRRQAAKLLAEFLNVKIPPANIICSDSVYRLVSPQSASCLCVFENDNSLRIRISIQALSDTRNRFWLKYALSDQDKISCVSTRLFADSTVFSPSISMVPSRHGVYLNDVRFGQYVFADCQKKTASSIYSAKNWPLIWAHTRLMGDTAQFAQVQELLSMPNSIGKKHLELVNLFTVRDTLYGFINYVWPHYGLFKGEKAILHSPQQFLVRLENGQPVFWRHTPAGFNLPNYYIQPFSAVTQRNGKWYLPITNTSIKKYSEEIPIACEAVDAGVELCATGVAQLPYNHLPAEIAQLPMPYSYWRHQYAGKFLIFDFVNKIVNTDNSREFAVPDFVNRPNSYKDLELTSVDGYRVQGAVQVMDDLCLLVASQGRKYYVVLDSVGTVNLISICPLPVSETIRWGLDGRGEVVGFDTDTNSLVQLP